MTLEGYPKMKENPKIFMFESFILQKSCWLVKVVNTATGSEALILSMYTNYFKMVLFAFESLFYILKKPQNFTDIIFKLKTRLMLSCVAGCCSALTNMAAHSLYHKTELCIVI